MVLGARCRLSANVRVLGVVFNVVGCCEHLVYGSPSCPRPRDDWGLPSPSRSAHRNVRSSHTGPPGSEGRDHGSQATSFKKRKKRKQRSGVH